jgi:hypothetical protein
VLKTSPRDPEALAGGGEAAFAEGNYQTASTMLARALAAGASDSRLEGMLETARLVAALDPFQRRLSARNRSARAERALEVASIRLRGCQAASTDATLQGLSAELAALDANKSSDPLRDLDEIEPIMELVFRIEQAAAQHCGQPTGADLALLLLARQRQAVP